MPRVMEITTPLGEDVLLFHGMHARDEMGRLSQWDLSLLSVKHDVSIDAILGKNVTIKLALPDDKTRYFNGFVTRFSQGGIYGRYHRYVARVHPWTWFLTRTADSRIFQDMTVPDIIKKVFADHTTASFTFELTSSYRKWIYCVQYRETDFNFISRLMEHEGIYYYFRHENGKHTMVLTDSTSKHVAAPGYKALKFIAPGTTVRPEYEHINSWDFSREVQPGVYVHDDYDFERPSVELRKRKPLARGYSPSDYEVYDYPGLYVKEDDGAQYVGVRIDELGSQYETCHGATNARGVAVGSLFTLEQCPRPDQNREHLILAASYDLEFSDYEGMPHGEGSVCKCSFVAMSSAQQFRPRRLTPKPFVQGPQTAVVVGPGGEEIYTDEYGRVKVQFHWDRRGEKDENSSCWIRVSSPWAGKTWGGIAIPRIGQEVVVDFLEGDPDQPIITGRVYNAEQMPPYTLPANKTQSGVKSRSSLEGTPENFNEIRFEDKKGAEQLFIHAEKNQDIEVENDETHWVGHDRKKKIDNDETTHVNHNRTETVGNDESITIGNDRREDVERNETITIGKNRTETVGDNEDVTVGKDQTLTVRGNRTRDVVKSETVTIGKAQSLSVGETRTTNVGKDDALTVGKRLIVDVGDQISLTTGSASITMRKDGTITIKGKDITIEGSGKINVKASSNVVIKGSKITQN